MPKNSQRSQFPTTASAVHPAVDTTAAPPRFGRRYLIGVFLLLAVSVGYVDRINISVAAPAISDTFHLSSAARGVILSSFSWGYAAMMVPGGILLDRLGKRVVLPLFVCIWTIASVLTGAMTRFGTLIGIRVLLGIGEAPTYPTGNLVIREWAPLRERGVFTSLMQSGSLFGPAVATAPAALLVSGVGWRPSFFILGSLGVVWLVGWLVIYRPPESAWWLGDRERSFILANRVTAAEAPGPAALPQAATVKMSLGSLLRQRSMIGLLLANGAQTYAAYFLLTWLPSYLVSNSRGFKLTAGGGLTSLMYAIALVGAISLGYASDRWWTPSVGASRRGGRRKVVALLMVIGVVPLVFVPWISGAAGLVIAIAVTLMVVTTSITLTFALTSDLIADDTSSGRTFGLLSFGGQVFGLLAPLVTGVIVGAGGYTPVFLLTGALLLVGAAVVWVLPTRALQPAGQMSSMAGAPSPSVPVKGEVR